MSKGFVVLGVEVYDSALDVLVKLKSKKAFLPFIFFFCSSSLLYIFRFNIIKAPLGIMRGFKSAQK